MIWPPFQEAATTQATLGSCWVIRSYITAQMHQAANPVWDADLEFKDQP